MAAVKFLYLNSRDEFFRFDVSKIVYMEAQGNYIHIVTANGLSGEVCMSLAKMEQLISGGGIANEKTRFARIGKRFIVNMNFIFRINTLKQELVLSDQQSFAYTLSISKDALKTLKDILTNKIKKE